jgi:Mg2+-importing ATPase
MFFIGPISSIFDYATFFTMIYVFHAWNNPGLFQSGWFVESLLSQTLIVHVIRTGKIPFIQSKASVPLLVMTGVICAIGVALPYSQFAHALDLVALPLRYWLALAAILLAYMTLTQLVKTWLIRRFGLS